MTEETYSRPEVDRAIEAAFRLGFGNALAEVDGDLHSFGHGRRRRCCAHARYWRTRRPSFRTAATPGLRRRLSRLWKPSRNTRSVGNGSSMRFHPTGRGHEDDEDGQEGCSTTANASLIG